jgi:hypothetical protein
MSRILPGQPLDAELRKRGIAYSQDAAAQKAFQDALREFIETKPLYSSYSIELPAMRDQFFLEVAQLDCYICRGTQPFRPPASPQWVHYTTSFERATRSQPPRVFDGLTSHIFPMDLECQGCKRARYYLFIQVDAQNNKLRKFGQWPMWMPKIDPTLMKEFGPDAVLYRKALTTLNQGFGIASCAYLRRLIEKYINPLLALLREVKEQEGASSEDLQAISDVILAKDFTSKTKFAAQIAPSSVTAPGMNPLKTLHDILSDGLHNLDEEQAVETAQALIASIEYVIPRLRKQYLDQQKYIEALKVLNVRRSAPTTAASSDPLPADGE